MHDRIASLEARSDVTAVKARSRSEPWIEHGREQSQAGQLEGEWQRRVRNSVDLGHLHNTSAGVFDKHVFSDVGMRVKFTPIIAFGKKLMFFIFTANLHIFIF